MKPWLLVFIPMLMLACNWTDGQCWYKGDGGADFGTGAGVGGSFSVGAGGDGDYATPGASNEDSDDFGPQSLEDERGGPLCNESDLQIGFTASLFNFKTIVEDDGQGKAGGDQMASTSLRFIDSRGFFPETWTCDVTIRMPLRTEAHGKISAQQAAKIAAAVTTKASKEVMHSQSSWQPTMFCLKFGARMQEIFDKEYKGLGGRASAKR